MLVKNRIKKHSEFQEVIASGKLERGNTLYMYYISNTLGYTRFGISVPKKSGNAVIRNRIKRQVRAMCAQLTDYKKSVDVVFIIRKAYDIDSFDLVKNEMSELLKKLG